uniref:Methyltransferase domain-containing protein n=1 Tax=Homalodisca liturata TaxID=320908 RepID=A0A1B6J4W2_9HEMI
MYNADCSNNMTMQKTSFEIKNFICSLKKLLPLANSHMVHFITQNLFERLIPKHLQEEIMSLSINDANDLVLGSFSKINPQNERAPQLCDFLIQTHKLSLSESDLCLSFESLCTYLGSRGFGECSSCIIKNLMSVKKSHEVEMMSGIIDALARTEKCTHVVDIGGGKGYLSSVLALKHHLKVLSIDSSFITSKSAIKQIPKVEKLWTSLHKKASKIENTTNGSINTQSSNEEPQQKSADLCKVATMYITEETNVVKLIEDEFQEEVGGIALVGLHTCGNLAASSLRMFANNPVHMKCLVNVGCCYHLIVEEFDTNPPWLEVQSAASGIGFPMSTYLRDEGFVLGRNARMLAAQPPDRISHEGTLQTEALFYRALLEVYLEKKLCPPNGLPHFRVGKIAKKCSSFQEYVTKSVQRLGLNIQVDDGELQELYDSHSEKRKQLHVFFLLRLCVAPAIEAAIMLDRLLYLREQGIQDAYLTQLFDPVVSPRCYAIVAFNKISSTTSQTVQ